jgi:hypothetical protein
MKPQAYSSSSFSLNPTEPAATAAAVDFNEQIAFGAIARAGALPSGDGSSWLRYAEARLKRENQLGHHHQLWELGGSLMERRQEAEGGVSQQTESELTDRMRSWFEAGGGQLRYVQSSFLHNESGFKLIATETVGQDETVLTVPLKLLLCRQTARNVLIKRRGRYLGEELKSTFGKSEVWGLAVFLLHEHAKETAPGGPGSKWGPFLRSLTAKILSTEVVRALQGSTAVTLWKKVCFVHDSCPSNIHPF